MALLFVALTGCAPSRIDTNATRHESALLPAALDLRMVAPRVVVDVTGTDATPIVVGALRLSNGRIVTADAGSGRLIFYRLNGNPASTVDLRPLGVSAQQLLRVSADTIALISRISRAILFDGEGRQLRRIDAADVVGELPNGIRTVLGVLGGGRSLIGILSQRSAPPLGQSRWIDSIAIAVVAPDMRATHVLGPYPALIGAVKDSNRHQVWFAPHSVFTSIDSTFYYGFGDKYRLEAFSATGELARVITRSWQRIPVTDADIAAYIDGWGTRWITSTGAAAEAEKREMRSDPFFDYVPAFSQFVPGVSGELWVRMPNLIDAQWNGELNTVPLEPGDWSVFDARGRWRGIVTIPARVFLTDVGSDYALGIEYGVRRSRKLVMYDLPFEWTDKIR